MNYLILVSHGGLAEGLRTSLEMFAEDAMAEVIALGLKNGSSVDEFAEEFRMAVSHINLYQKGNFTYDTTTASLRNSGRRFQIHE